MKKIISFFIIYFLWNSVSAQNVGKFLALTDKCVSLNDNQLVIPVTVVGLNDGLLDKNIKEFKIAKIDHQYQTKIVNIEGEKVKDLFLDEEKDQNNQSYLKFSLNDNLSLKPMQEFLKFNIIIEIPNKLPSTINILGNEILIENKNICAKINKCEFKENENLIKINKEESIFHYNEKIYMIIIIILIIILMIVCFKKTKKD